VNEQWAEHEGPTHQHSPEPTPIDRSSDAFQSGRAFAKRQGDMLRVTLGATLRARCETCGLVLDNTGAAASHARGQRHTVACEYRSSFLFTPAPGGDW
jgi:hypothetical protein